MAAMLSATKIIYCLRNQASRFNIVYWCLHKRIYKTDDFNNRTVAIKPSALSKGLFNFVKLGVLFSRRGTDRFRHS